MFSVVILITCLLDGWYDFVVADDLFKLVVARRLQSKNGSSPAKALSIVKLNRALFTVGLISKHFDFANIVDEATRVCIQLVVGVIL